MPKAVEAAHAYFELAMQGSPELPALMAEDVTWTVPEHSPLGGTHRGRDAVLAMLERAFALYDVPTMKLELPLVFGDDEHACVRFTLEAKTIKGLDWEGDYVAVFGVRDGKISSVREYFDTQKLNAIVHA